MTRLFRGQFRAFFSLVFLLSSCVGRVNNCEQKGVVLNDGAWRGNLSGNAHFSLKASFSLKKAEELIAPKFISGKYFCLSDTAVIYDATPGSIKQPCFNFRTTQSFVQGANYSGDAERYEVINPEKFLSYYKSIPDDLNKFLVVQAYQYNAILKKSGVHKPVPSSYTAWDSYFNPFFPSLNTKPSLFLAGMLHGDLLTDEDSYIYIYLPLNLGIKTPEYAGTLPDKNGYIIEDYNFANPRFKLTPEVTQNLDLVGYEKAPGCGFERFQFTPELELADLRSILANYKKLVKDYLQVHPGAFPDPYATP